jgi:hypothetical protein
MRAARKVDHERWHCDDHNRVRPMQNCSRPGGVSRLYRKAINPNRALSVSWSPLVGRSCAWIIIFIQGAA